MIEIQELDLLEKNLTEDQMVVANRFWSALWATYVRNKGTTSLIYWTEQMGCSSAMNKLLIILKEWITTDVIPERNWAQVCLNNNKLIEEIGETALTQYRADKKLGMYIPRFKESSKTNLVRVRGKVSKTGLVREGFMKSGHTQYYYDTEMLTKHKKEVVLNTNKGMIKMRETHNIAVDDASYDQVAEEIVEELATNPQLFTQGVSYIDSRGRAIKESLKYVANPIGYKDFRALLVIPE